MRVWVGNAGPIMSVDNSLGFAGYNSQIGGPAPGIAAALVAAGIGYTFVGPISSPYGNHRSAHSLSAYQQTSQLQTDCETYRPRVVILGYLENDVGALAAGAQGRTPAQAIEAARVCMRWCRAGAPHVIIVQRTIVVPQTDAIPGHWERRELFAEVNDRIPALCAEEGATVADIDSATLETTDGIHMSQGSSGYPRMAARLAATLISLVPGGS